MTTAGCGDKARKCTAKKIPSATKLLLTHHSEIVDVCERARKSLNQSS
jgi:hypothetical protein